MIRRIFSFALLAMTLALLGPAQAQSLSTQQLATLRASILASAFAAALRFTVGN